MLSGSHGLHGLHGLVLGSFSLAEVSAEATGLERRNVFGSEFGAVVMSSFESMAPTLHEAHWGLHAGQVSAGAPKERAAGWGFFEGGVFFGKGVFFFFFCVCFFFLCRRSI